MTYSSQLRSWVCYFLASWLVNDETWMVRSASKFWLMSHLSLHSCILVHKLRNRNIPCECSRTNTGQDCCASFEHTPRNNSFFYTKWKSASIWKLKTNVTQHARFHPSISQISIPSFRITRPQAFWVKKLVEKRVMMRRHRALNTRDLRSKAAATKNENDWWILERGGAKGALRRALGRTGVGRRGFTRTR